MNSIRSSAPETWLALSGRWRQRAATPSRPSAAFANIGVFAVLLFLTYYFQKGIG
jgi:hypothetical protein